MSDGQAAYHQEQLEVQRDLCDLYTKLVPYCTDDEAHLLAWGLCVPYLEKDDAQIRAD